MNVIFQFLERTGIDPISVMNPEGMRIAKAFDPYRKVDLATVLHALQNAAERTGRPDIALELGLRQPLEEWGPLTFLFHNAPTVRDAFKDLRRYGAVLQSQAHFQLIDQHDHFGIEYSSNHPELTGWELDNEITIALFMSIINGLTDTNVTPRSVLFEHQPICPLKDYKHLLGVAPRFQAITNTVIYSASLAEQVPPNANPELYKVLKRHMSDLTEAEIHENQLVHFVRNNIGRGLNQGTATLDYISAEVGLEPRTLQRRLKVEGISFQALTDQVRLIRARYFLEKTRLSITEIALELGYTETSAFVRAFKRLTGFSPGQYRARNIQRQ